MKENVMYYHPVTNVLANYSDEAGGSYHIHIGGLTKETLNKMGFIPGEGEIYVGLGTTQKGVSSKIKRGFIVKGYEKALRNFMINNSLNTKNALSKLGISPFIHLKVRSGHRVDQRTVDKIKKTLDIYVEI